MAASTIYLYQKIEKISRELKSNFDCILSHLDGKDSPPISNREWTPLGHQEKFNDPLDLETITATMAYFLEKMPDIALLKFGPNDDDNAAKYLLENYQRISSAVQRLQNFLPQSKNSLKMIEFIKIHQLVTLTASLIANHNVNGFLEFCGDTKKFGVALNRLPSTQFYDQIKTVFNLDFLNAHYIKKLFMRGRHLDFIGACLRLDNLLVKKF